MSNLFTCPDCGGPVSRSAYSCPKCGRVFRETPANATASGVKTVSTILLAIIVVPFFLLMVGVAIVGLLSGP
ncbi:MAG: hypothetical protein WBC44_02640 [Planctomycetaceae bacterium]